MTREELDRLIDSLPPVVFDAVTAGVAAQFAAADGLLASAYESALVDWLVGKGYSVTMVPRQDETRVFIWDAVTDDLIESTRPTGLAALVECVKQVAAREAKQP